MPISTSEVSRRFHSGKKSGKGANIEIVDHPNDTLLVDFGWAVLAKRDKKTGDITYYSGWDRYSRTTSRHITKAGLRGINDIMNEKPTLDTISNPKYENKIQRFRDSYDDVFIDPFTKKLRMRRR